MKIPHLKIKGSCVFLRVRRHPQTQRSAFESEVRQRRKAENPVKSRRETKSIIQMDKKLKILVSVFMLLILPVALYAQKDVTEFLGIPVDGFKPEMIQKLKSKGFTNNPQNKDVLDGEFNGTNVNVFIVTNNNKVCRIMVSDANTMSEGNIKIRFNKLCQQFLNNKRYLSASPQSDYTLSDDEDISYGLSVKNKRYEAVFYQLPADLDSVAPVAIAEISPLLLSKYTKEQLSNPTEEMKEDILKTTISYLLEKYSKRTVWFMISSLSGQYYISMYYDNEYNRANGEDL